MHYSFDFLLNLYNLRPLQLIINHDLIPDSTYSLLVFWKFGLLFNINKIGNISTIEKY